MTDNREILLVEDDPADARLIRSTLVEFAPETVINHVEDGVDAMEYLYRRGRYSRAPRPDLVVLDLNLPRKDGREVLAEIKQDDNLRLIPVVVFTTSTAEQDVVNSYKLNANCYISKPLELNAYVDAVRMMNKFWVDTAKLPPRDLD